VTQKGLDVERVQHQPQPVGGIQLNEGVEVEKRRLYAVHAGRLLLDKLLLDRCNITRQAALLLG